MTDGRFHLGQLRHTYSQIIGKHVGDLNSFAKNLLAPAIAEAEKVADQRDKLKLRIETLQAAIWIRCVTMNEDPAKTIYCCRICSGLDKSRNWEYISKMRYTNLGHQGDCPFKEQT